MYTNPGLIGALATCRQAELIRAARAPRKGHHRRRRAAQRSERESAPSTPLILASRGAPAGHELLESA
jgi:hypothetical protein